MTKKSLQIAIFFIAVVLVAACERSWQEYGGSSAVKISAPSYDVQSKVTMMAQPANIESVAPKGALDGQALFNASCMACHQATGQGVPGAFPPLDGSAYVVSDNIERLAAIMIYGLQGPINVKGSTFNSVMAPWGHFKDDQLAAIASYVRSAWSNNASPVEASTFAEVRKKYGARGPFSISELGEEYVN